MITTSNGQLLDPLEVLYKMEGLPLPACEQVPGDAIPRPYRDLLVHDSDMTSTLERHHGAVMHLRPLYVQSSDGVLLRHVTLVTDAERVVEIGAIRITLERFAPEARRLIEACHEPLGTVLSDCEVTYVSHPTAFFRLQSDAAINATLGLNDTRELYGRRNVLSRPSGETLAEVIEILPPMERDGD